MTVILLVLAALAAAMPAGAGDRDPTGQLRLEAVDATRHPDVTATVVAPRELAGTDLTGGAFAVVENGRNRNFDVERVVPQEIVLAVDTSGSMRGDALEEAKGAAREFLARTPEQSRVAVVAFATVPQVVQGLTHDREAVHAALAELDATGNTALYDGVVASAELFDGERATARAVVVLSDGADTASTTGIDEAGAAVAATGAGLYVVELVTPSTDRAALEQLAEVAGGAVASAAEATGLEAVYAAFAVDVNNRYEVRYRSSSYGLASLAVQVEAGGIRQADSTAVELPAPPLWRRLVASPAALVAGTGAIGVALVLLAGTVLPMRRRRSYAGLGPSGARPSGLEGWAGRASALAQETLTQRGWANAVDAALERAGVALRPGEFLVVAAGGVLGAAAVGTLLSGLLLGAVLGAVAGVAAKLYLSVRATRRRAKFADQLDDTLQLLAGSLRAGHSLLQALDAVSKEADAPARDEFRQIVRETRIGRDLTASMHDASERMASDDFEWIVQSVAIHREVGGDLAAILDTAAATIRERGQLRRQVKALSAEGRLSAFVLLALPVGLAGFMILTNPDYIGVLTTHPIGWAMLTVSGVLMAGGGLWLSKLVKIKL